MSSAEWAWVSTERKEGGVVASLVMSRRRMMLHVRLMRRDY